VGNTHRKLLAYLRFACIGIMQNGEICFDQFFMVQKRLTARKDTASLTFLKRECLHNLPAPVLSISG
jgi:hypothetical protein